MTGHPELFAALAAPFVQGDVKSRTQGGKQLHYITARTAMNRLDEVLGPENWWDEYQPGEHSVLCRLTIRMPDGSTLTKCDAGGYAGMADQGDDDKSGFSDAFKRACVKLGVARYLYRDGVPSFVRDPSAVAARAQAAAPAPTNGSGHGSGKYPPPETVKKWREYVEAECVRVNALWLDEWGRSNRGEIPEGVPDPLIHPIRLHNHVAKAAQAAGIVDWDGGEQSDKGVKVAALAWSRQPEGTEAEATAYLRRLWQEERSRVKAKLAAAPGADHGDGDAPDEPGSAG